MSHSRKHVVAGAVQDYPVPEGEQQIVRVKEMRGGNIVEVELPNGEQILCLLPAKFKKTLWIKRGNYLIIEPFTEVVNKADKKLRGRIATVLFPNHVKNIERLGLWPSEWKADPAGKTKGQQRSSESSDGEEKALPEDKTEEHDGDEDEDPYLVNPNHQRAAFSDGEDEGDSDDDDDDEEEEEDSDDEEEIDTD